MAHSDEKYKCERFSDCPYTGTTPINKKPWGDWPAGETDESEEEDQAEKSDIDIEEGSEKEMVIEEPAAQDTNNPAEENEIWDEKEEKELKQAVTASLSLRTRRKML